MIDNNLMLIAAVRGTAMTTSENRKRIMVIDNEDSICEIYKRVLVDEGFEVEVYNDGGSAVERASQADFDIVITDLKMPKYDGIYVIKKIREISPKTDIIVISGYATLDSVIQTIKMGAKDYLVKPFEIFELIAKVQKCVQMRGSC